MPTIPQPQYFVYILCRPNNKAFYVGKGKGRRVFDHETEAKNGHKCHKCNVIRKIWKNGGEVRRYVVFTTDDEQEAYQYERELIEQFGRKNLCNQTDGGEGMYGVSDEYRAHISEKVKGLWQSPEFRTKMEQRHDAAHRAAASEKRKELWKDPAFREKATQGYTLEVRASMSESMKQRWQDPDHRARVSAKIREAKAKKKTSQPPKPVTKKMTEYWQDPEWRATMLARRAEPDVAARRSAGQSERVKAKWQEPEFQEKMKARSETHSARMKAMWADPEFRARRKK